MNLTQSYLMRARKNANEQYSNFGGAQGFNSPMNFAGNQGAYFNAAGDAASPAVASDASESQPYILMVSNSAASNVANFDILGASTYLYGVFNQGSWSSGGNLTVSGVTISSLISNVSYQDFLFQSTSNPFTIGLTYIMAQVNNAQPFQTYTINTKDSNGNQALRTIPPFLDPYQNQSSISVNKTPYRIDGLTKITFANILPSAVFFIYLFPAANVNPARALGDGSQVRGYGNPDVIRSNVAVIPNAAGTVVANRIGR